jgi:hypothetical protein
VPAAAGNYGDATYNSGIGFNSCVMYFNGEWRPLEVLQSSSCAAALQKAAAQRSSSAKL